jgi:hypothetical protein
MLTPIYASHFLASEPSREVSGNAVLRFMVRLGVQDPVECVAMCLSYFFFPVFHGLEAEAFENEVYQNPGQCTAIAGNGHMGIVGQACSDSRMMGTELETSCFLQYLDWGWMFY